MNDKMKEKANHYINQVSYMEGVDDGHRRHRGTYGTHALVELVLGLVGADDGP